MTKRAVLMVCLLFTLASAASAQEYPKGEIFGGYSYLRLNDSFNFNGWQASVTGNVSPWFGVEADVSGHYGSTLSSILPFLPFLSVPTSFLPGWDVNVHSFQFGPKVSIRKSYTAVPFVHFLAGVSRIRTSYPFFSTQYTDFSMSAGGGLDLRLTDTLAIRAAQADYLMTTFGGRRSNNVRFSFGIVYRF